MKTCLGCWSWDYVQLLVLGLCSIAWNFLLKMCIISKSLSILICNNKLLFEIWLVPDYKWCSWEAGIVPILFNASTETLDRSKALPDLQEAPCGGTVKAQQGIDGFQRKGTLASWKDETRRRSTMNFNKDNMKAHIQGRLILCINTDREVTYIGQAKNVSSPCSMLAGCILGYFMRNIASGSRVLSA